ncbi:Charged multivesicular body protein 3 [Chamberlinius hualienensis]
MGLFGKAHGRDPKEQVQEWTSKMRQESRLLDRQIRSIMREEAKAKSSLKEIAKKGDKEACVIVAKEIIQARKAISRIYVSKAQINSIIMTMRNQLATSKLAGSLQKSTEVMKSMNSLVRIPEVQATMTELSKEMMKAGIIEEMVEDTMEGMDNQEDLEEAAQEEVDKVLWEITAGHLGKAPAAVSDSLPATSLAAAAADSDEDVDVTEMQSRLEALRS